MQQPLQRLAGKPHVPRKATTCRSTAEVKIIEVPPRNARPIPVHANCEKSVLLTLFIGKFREYASEVVVEFTKPW